MLWQEHAPATVCLIEHTLSFFDQGRLITELSNNVKLHDSELSSQLVNMT